MAGKYTLLAIFFFCHVSGIDSRETYSDFTSKLSKYSIVNPHVIHRWQRNINTQPQSNEKNDSETISYAITIKNRKHILHLKKNRDFLHPNLFKPPSHSTGNHSSYLKQHVHCYYHGQVEGYEESVVAVSTCSGLRGVIILGNETYALEPVPQSPTNDHLLYLLKDVRSGPFTCGVVHEATSKQSHDPFEPGQSLTSLLRRKRNLPVTSYIELVLVVDNLRYNFKKKNETAVQVEAVEIANYVDGFLKPLNIRVVLVGLQIFKTGNPFTVNGSAGNVLDNFVTWRKTVLVPQIRNDIAHLIVGLPSAYPAGILGMAFVGTVCSMSTSGGISVFSDEHVQYYSTVVAHEIGHNLGMNHDDSRCSCNGSCIMYSSASGSTSFSTCSSDDFEALIFRGGGVCLRNLPSPSNVINVAECGNGLVDEGEQCDCGKPQDCTNKCCNAATCKFTFGSSCAQGLCCDNCEIKVSGTPCRASVDACDLPEYCDGSNASCPADTYIMDGLSCENNAAYCYDGRCQTYNFQCRQLFVTDTASKAADVCFVNANMEGNLFGNCGMISKGNYIKCTKANSMCGKVQCNNVNTGKPPLGAHISISVVDGETCVNADFNLGSDVLDPGYVKTGSPCSPGKACLDFQCVNASALLPNLTCDAQTTCNGRGVCNQKGHCHCQNGWAPPYCDKSGRGGSIDSGPAEIDYSLRNGLLIFFLLVVPVLVLLILVLLYVFKRESLDPCLKRTRKSQTAQNANTNGPSNINVQTSATTQPPAPAPRVQPGDPPVAPASDSRYGDHDYWNIQTSTAPARPPAPQQGPGVPKPIPPKPPQC
ncbi:hypothetical protein Q5P01_023480 [Channa striata]|uniref:Disintegrin and metalloproteinase domain-containing protein 9 n=1 Tax=Channa striata TaxID=64152 RepID=A0AA88LQZ5_CHASR|nr:hypothetical protein Q5P01_023480 [Channa striata]